MSTSPPLIKYKYRRRLPHLQKADTDLFVTFCTGGPLILPGEARSLVLEHCLREHGQRIVLRTVVVMPDHVHLLLGARRDREGWPFPLVDILQCLKSSTAHRINKLLHWADEITVSAPNERVDLEALKRPRLGGKEPSDDDYRL